MIPDDLRYTREHEWLRETANGTVVFGITHYAQDALGDIVFVDLPAVGSTLEVGASCGEVESTKSVSEIYAPVSGEIVAVNGALADAPDLVNSDPYGDGWMVEVRVSDPGNTLDASEYAELTGGS